MVKYFIYTGCLFAATVLSAVATGRTLDPFDNPGADAFCDKPLMQAFRAFAILTPIAAGLGMIAGAVAIATKNAAIKLPAVGLGFAGFAFGVIAWAIIAAKYEDKKVNLPGYGGDTVCALPYTRPDFLAMTVAASVLALVGAIVLLAMPDEAAAAAPAAAQAGAEAGNTENKAPEEIKTKENEETPAPQDDNNNQQQQEEENRKRQQQEEAQRQQQQQEEERKRKEQEEAQRKQQQQQEEAAAAAAAASAAQAAEAQRQEEERKRQQEEQEAAQRKQQEEAAAAEAQRQEEERKRKEQEEAAAAEAAKNSKPQINWKEINAKLPYDKKNKAQKERRFAMFDQIDINKTGKVSLSEVTAGMTTVLGLGEEIDVPVVIKTAFDKAKVAGQQAGVNEDASGGDFIEKNEFRLFLMYTRMYFEMYQLFSELDETGDMRIELGEFEKSIPLLKSWGAKIDDAAETFKQIDKNGGGKVLFGEFVDWALSPEQNLDCPDDDE